MSVPEWPGGRVEWSGKVMGKGQINKLYLRGERLRDKGQIKYSLLSNSLN